MDAGLATRRRFANDLAGLTAAEQVFRLLFSAISRGDILPGSIETEERLAARFSVSRTPLRDAARRLEALGLLVREPARGLRIPLMTMREMHDLSATREALESLLAASAARQVASGIANTTQLRSIHERHINVLRLGDPELTLAVGYDFHAELQRLSGNRSAAACHEQILLSFDRYRHLARHAPERPEGVVSEHTEVLHAIEAGDAIAAEAAMRRHIAAGRALYAAVLAGTLE